MTNEKKYSTNGKQIAGLTAEHHINPAANRSP